MKRGSTLFLKLVIILIGVVVLSWMIYFPTTEGRAVNLDLVSIYSDPFIIYLYIASTPFFVALYQAFKILGLIAQNKVFSKSAVDALKNIKYCASSLCIFIIAALAFVIPNAKASGDDPAGFVALGVLAIFASVVMATGTAVAQRLLQNAVDIKSQSIGR